MLTHWFITNQMVNRINFVVSWLPKANVMLLLLFLLLRLLWLLLLLQLCSRCIRFDLSGGVAVIVLEWFKDDRWPESFCCVDNINHRTTSLVILLGFFALEAKLFVFATHTLSAFGLFVSFHNIYFQLIWSLTTIVLLGVQRANRLKHEKIDGFYH